MNYSSSELLSTSESADSSEAETQYVLNNPTLMRQINQIKTQHHQTDMLALQESFDLAYILSNSDLVQQIRLLVETHKKQKYAIDCVSGGHIASL
jgi:hypothetical protein